jgi:hypothetical protein
VDYPENSSWWVDSCKIFAFTAGQEERMQRKFLVAFAVVALTCVALLAQERRSVVLEVGLPNGETPQLKILDGETGTVDMPNVGKFGFVPTVKDGTVLVEVFDMSKDPHRQMGRVEAAVGGDTVQSKSKPQFGIRVIRVATQ